MEDSEIAEWWPDCQWWPHEVVETLTTTVQLAWDREQVKYRKVECYIRNGAILIGMLLQVQV